MSERPVLLSGPAQQECACPSCDSEWCITRYRITWRTDRLAADAPPSLAREVVLRTVTEGTELELLDAAEASGLLGDLADDDGRYVGALMRHRDHARPYISLRGSP